MVDRQRMLVVAVDGWRVEDTDLLHADPTLAGTTGLRELVISPGGANEPFPALAGLATGCTSALSGIASEAPFDPRGEAPARHWYADALARPTLLDAARAAGLRTAALQWPATAGAGIDLNLPLVEDLKHHRDRWSMTLATSSPEMVERHLEPRHAAGVHLSRVPRDELVTQVARDVLSDRGPGAVDVALVRLEGLATARREGGVDSRQALTARGELAGRLDRILTAFAPTRHDVLALVTGRPVVPVRLQLHPNAALAAAGLVRTEDARIAAWDAFVWPDGPRGVLHVRRGAAPGTGRRALEVLEGFAARCGASVRPIPQGRGATTTSDALAVLEGAPGGIVEASAVRRDVVPGDDPYYAGPRTVSNPDAPALTWATGPGLPGEGAHGGWAGLGVDLARAIHLSLVRATASGLRCPDGRDLRRAS